MKAKLEFNLPEEQISHEDAVNGYKWRLIVEDMYEWCWRWDRLNQTPTTRDVRDALATQLKERGLDL